MEVSPVNKVCQNCVWQRYAARCSSEHLVQEPQPTPHGPCPSARNNSDMTAGHAEECTGSRSSN
jgi:hypothetical protein